MPTFSADRSTPTYVLMKENRRIGPRLTPDSDKKCDVIYGFSNKTAYEAFRQNSDVALTPYPLVRGYLRNQVEEPRKEHKLVAIDALGPLDATLPATTMGTVLEAQEEGIDHVVAVYLLTLSAAANAYQLAEISATT